MANTRPAPAAGAVPDPGGIRLPTNLPSGSPIPRDSGVPSPSIASVGVSRPGSTLPLNTPRTQPVPQLSGGSPAPAIQAVGSGPGGAALPTASQPATTGPLGGGLVGAAAAGAVPDPGASRLPLGVNQAIGMPPDQAIPAGGDPRALGTSYSSADADAPTWYQGGGVSGNPNPGALPATGAPQIPGLYPGETPANQVNPNANPNPGAL